MSALPRCHDDRPVTLHAVLYERTESNSFMKRPKLQTASNQVTLAAVDWSRSKERCGHRKVLARAEAPRDCSIMVGRC